MSQRGEEHRLSGLDGFAFPVSCTAGGETRARAVAQRMERAVAWLDGQVGTPSVPALFVVGPEEWDGIALGLPYGMPHVEDGRIVVGQRPGPFWQTLLDAAAPGLPAESRQRLAAVYGEPPDLGTFADLLVVHELGHVTHGEGWPGHSVGFWLRELAANLCLHGYVAEIEPESMPVLETVYDVIWETGPGPWPVRDLHCMADSLAGDGTNYVWFQFGLQILARRLWESADTTALRGVVALLRGPAQPFGNVIDVLATFDRHAARAVLDWPHLGNAVTRDEVRNASSA
ncbi:hypothetical protein ACWD8I_05080 [Micromonospora arida]